MVHDQADELRILVRQRALAGAAHHTPVPLIVVAGGKGGVGATTVAVNLAIALARYGRRAVWVDADLDHGGNACLSQHPQRGSVVDILSGRRTVHEVLDRGPSGIQVLSGQWASEELIECSPAAQNRFIADLKNLAPHAEIVVVDAGSNRNPFVQRFWHAANLVLLVTTTDVSAIMETYAAIKVLQPTDARLPIYPLVNLAPDAQTAAAVQARIAEACRRFLGLQVTPAGSIGPCDTPPTSESLLIYPPRCEAARALDRVADTLWTQLQSGALRPPAAQAA